MIRSSMNSAAIVHWIWAVMCAMNNYSLQEKKFYAFYNAATFLIKALESSG